MPEIPDPIKEQCLSKGGIEGIVALIPSDQDIDHRSLVFRALAEPMRQKILFALVEQPLCACLLKEMLAISDSKLSYHLSILKDAELIKGKKEGSWIIYQPTKKGNSIAMLIQDF
ncbi:MAG: winged helix-turn-helix transcriptional regulator [Thermoplasmata archaeon]|nr:winged helix-turn-helix transcriptional regulator [Thermoplasmata archaeon]MCK5397903.1 winged helix-turn-helix transcriptional regulator [Thermoplasmata archaeon]